MNIVSVEDKGDDGAMGDGGAFRNASGAGGIDDISEIVGADGRSRIM
jgi:hypothetical protein